MGSQRLVFLYALPSDGGRNGPATTGNLFPAPDPDPLPYPRHLRGELYFSYGQPKHCYEKTVQ